MRYDAYQIAAFGNAHPWVKALPADTDPAVRRLVARALMDLVTVLEVPLGSNRGPEIDEYVTRFGSPLASYWCACQAGACRQDAGLEVPPKLVGSCDAWVAWAIKTGRWSKEPTLGAAVVYGKQATATTPADATHIGTLVRLAQLPLSVEGNTTVEGPRFERNGTAVALKIADPKSDPILGYIWPYPVGAASTSGSLAA